MGVTQGRLLPAAAQRAQTIRTPGTPHHCIYIYPYLPKSTHIYTPTANVWSASFN